jgi:ribosomal protein L14E/L6E/L27E
VLLFDDLLKQPERQQVKVIFHEIAHFKLEHHRNIEAKTEMEKDNEADELAEKWLEDYEKSLKNGRKKNE